MNWTDLDTIYNRAVSGEMTIKESSDQISQIWYLLKFNTLCLETNINLKQEQEKLLDLTITLCKVAGDDWQQRWMDSIPTEMKAIEILKKILQERGIKTS